MDLKEGMIGFSGGDKWIQKAIRFFIGSEFSHSFTTKNNDKGVLCALETSSTTVMFGPMSDKLNELNWVEMWDVIVPEDKKQASLAKMLPYIGKWYGYLSYIWFMYRWLMRKFGYEPKKMWWWCKGGLTCTELTQKYPKDFFPELFEGIDPNTIAPPELRKIMVANPDKFVYKGWYIYFPH